MPKSIIPAIALFTLATATALSAGAATAAQTSEALGSQADSPRFDLKIPAGSLSAALNQLAKQTGVDLVYRPDQVQGLKTSGVSGQLTTQDAVSKLLEGTSLALSTDASGAMLIAAPQSFKPTAGIGAPGELHLAQAEQASAQTGQAGGEAGAEPRLEEVVVTAAHRKQTLQEAPLAVSAFTGETLQNRGAQEFSEYFRLVPGLTAVDRGPGQKKYILRGLNSESAPRLAPIVQQYLDEFPLTLTGGGQSDVRLYDVERVEVLRGPQGTLYGSGSMGGTVRTITRRADLNQFNGDIDLTLSDTQEGGTNAMGHVVVNVPIVKGVLAVRALGYRERWHGFIDNVGTGVKDENDNDIDGGRLAVAFQPLENLRFDLTLLRQNLEAGGQNEVMPGYQNPPPGAPLASCCVPGLSWYPATAAPLGELQVMKGISERQRDDNNISNLLVNWGIHGLNLLSSTTYYKRHNVFEQDVTELQGFGGFLRNDLRSKTWSQELRLSDDQGAFKWLTGLYYFEAQTDPEDNFQVAVFPDGSEFFRQGTDSTTKQRAVFAEGSYDLTPQLTGTLGVRYGENEFRSNTVELAPNFLFGSPPGTVGPTLQGTDYATTYKAQLTYAATADTTVYGVASSGFRAGGVNDTGIAPPGAIPGTFESDSLWNYELGVKTYLFDRRATFNNAVFYIDWSNIQVSSFYAPVATSYTTNAGGAEVYGVETEFSFRATDRLTLGFSGSYIQAQLTEDQPPLPPGPSTPLAGLKGDDLPNVPNFSGALLADYTVPLSGDWRGFVSSTLTYTGDSNTAFRPGDPKNQKQDSYTLLGLRLGVENDAWRVTLFGNNLTDERAQLFVNSLSPINKTTINRPRTFGITVNRKF